eukprot:jgi/Mesen1/3023/ME000178S02150
MGSSGFRLQIRSRRASAPSFSPIRNSRYSAKPKVVKVKPSSNRPNLYRRGKQKFVSQEELASRLLKSPQLQMEGTNFPLLSSCLAPMPLEGPDLEWMDENLDEVYEALGYPLVEWEGQKTEDPQEPSPMDKLDELLFLSFMHSSPHVPAAIAVTVVILLTQYLGEKVLQLALAELFLQRYPRETPGEIRERVLALTIKKRLPYTLKRAGLDLLVWPKTPLERVASSPRQQVGKCVVRCPPVSDKSQHGRLSSVVERRCQPPPGALFEHPRLYRACVPPGMHRFRGSDWMKDSLVRVLDAVQYPRAAPGVDLRIKQARNEELVLALQLAFMHPSLHKREHPRFCFERLEYIGQVIQDLVLAEKLLMQNLDAPILWLEERHSRVLRNTHCGRYLKAKGMDKHVLVDDWWRVPFESSRRARLLTCASVQQGIHGVGYLVYGKQEVRRLMFNVFQMD